MVSATLSSPVSGLKLSSVVPARVTEGSKDHDLTNMDLAMKLHYVRGVYFFSSETVQGFTVYDLKKPMFPWLDLFYTTSGRIRRSETGRPFIKCNDSGVRIVEPSCDKTIEEWLKMNSDHSSVDNFLVYDQEVGPDLGFSPLVFIQFTSFKCGGMSVGLTWAHVLGDPFSASNFMNTWAQIMGGQGPSKSLHVPYPRESKYPCSTPREPFSLKRIDPVGDHWITTSNCKMETHSFHVIAKQLGNIVSDSCGLNQTTIKISHFEILSAIIWKSLSKVREDLGPRTVTICTRNSSDIEHEALPSNKMVFSTVQADFSVPKGDIYDLAVLIAEKQEEENSLIEDMMEKDHGGFDYIAYGANLTFVNMEQADVYGLELKGQRPVFANYSIKGVGDEGAVLVLPGPDNGSEKRGGGRTLTLILPENQLTDVMEVLRKEWGLV